MGHCAAATVVHTFGEVAKQCAAADLGDPGRLIDFILLELLEVDNEGPVLTADRVVGK